MEEPLAQVFSASSQWKFGSYKVPIASERLIENGTQCIMVSWDTWPFYYSYKVIAVPGIAEHHVFHGFSRKQFYPQ